MTPEKEEWLTRAHRTATRIKRLLEIDAPDVIVGREVAMLYYMAVAYLGDNASIPIVGWQSAAARMWAGLCNRCGRKLSRPVVFSPLCDPCNGHELAEDFKFEVEHGDDILGGPM